MLAACTTTDRPPTAAMPPLAPGGRPQVPSQPPALPAQPAANAAPAVAVVATPPTYPGYAVRPARAAQRVVHAAGRPRLASRPRPQASYADSGRSSPLALSNRTAPLLAPDEAPDSTQNSLRAFRAWAGPPTQVFQLRPGRDTIVVGQQGTRLVVPGTAFDVPAGSGPVQLTVREFYSTPDIVLAGLTTTSGPDLLETGGMLHLQASANGQPVKLRAGAQLLVQLPAARRQPDMQLFSSAIGPGHSLDWHPAAAPAIATKSKAWRRPGRRRLLGRLRLFGRRNRPTWSDSTFDKRAYTPLFAGGSARLTRLFHEQLAQQPAELEHLRLSRRSSASRRELIVLSKEQGQFIVHTLRMKLMLDTLGAIQDVQLPSPGAAGGAAAAAAVCRLPAFRPAHGPRITSRYRPGPVPMTGEMRILYTAKGQHLLRLNWDVGAAMRAHDEAFKAWRQNRDLAALAARDAQRAEFRRKYPALAEALDKQPQFKQELASELVSEKLDWINCDRYLRGGPRIEFAVRVPDPATVVSLVFKQQRSFLASSIELPTEAQFQSVPSGAAVTVVALRRAQGVTYLATQEVVIGQSARPDLQFHAVTLAQLRTELARL